MNILKKLITPPTYFVIIRKNYAYTFKSFISTFDMTNNVIIDIQIVVINRPIQTRDFSERPTGSGWLKKKFIIKNIYILVMKVFLK